jgi:hypothetical protein
MTPPLEIPFSSISLGERGRSEYTGIERLADSIRDNGLIQPLVLVPIGPLVNGEPPFPWPNPPNFGLDAGGRRYHALKLRLNRGEWNGTLYHASTSDPEHPGYVLKGEQFATPFQRAMTEIAENLDRSDPDWRDQVKMIVRAWKLAQSEHHANGEDILMRDFGSMIGVEYTKLQAAITVHDELIANPEKFKDCGGIRAACTKLLKMNLVDITKLQAAKSLSEGPQLVQNLELGSGVSIQSEPQPIAKAKPIVIPLTTAFIRCDSLDYMIGLPGPTFDHIICDPDYGVSVERLEANMDTGSGVAQATVTDSLDTMRRFIPLAWKTIRDQGFLVMWYDLDHHEKLQALATSVGFAVQRWPLIWHKMDYRSNAAPAYNFTKNVEYAMVCRKPNAVLARAQTSTVFSAPSGTTARDFNHPFSKPPDVWRWIFSACCIKGQNFYDPFLGAGSSAVAGLDWGLKPMGSELDEGHYANALMNLQGVYKKLLGGNVTFS